MTSKSLVPYKKTARKYKGKGKGKGKNLGTGHFQKSKWNPRISFAPDQQFVTFKYKETFNLQCGAGAGIGELSWYGNCPNDPSTSPGLGRVPIGWAQWQGIFQRAYCPSSVISVKFHPYTEDSTSQGVPIRVVLLPHNELTPAASIDEMASRPRAQSGLVVAGNGPVHFTKKATMRAVTGERADNSDQSFLMATVPTPPPATANPVTQWYWRILAEPLIATTATFIAVEICIMYNTVMYSRRFVAPGDNGETV